MNIQKIAEKIFTEPNSIDAAITNACIEYNLTNKQANELKERLSEMQVEVEREEDFLYHNLDQTWEQ